MLSSHLCSLGLLLFVQRCRRFQLSILSFLELLLLSFVLFHSVTHARFAELPWRPENSATMILFALLKVHSLALCLVFIFGFERAREAVVFMMEELVLRL
jgi:hypothetical protein